MLMPKIGHFLGMWQSFNNFGTLHRKDDAWSGRNWRK